MLYVLFCCGECIDVLRVYDGEGVDGVRSRFDFDIYWL